MTNQAAPFPLIDIAGKPLERGIQYGEKANTYIQRGIDTYKTAYAGLKISWEEACGTAGNFIPRLKKDELELFTEIEGIAKGAGCSVEEILALNCRTEIIYGQKGKSDEPTDGCTGVIAMPETTANGHLLHGQNWDWRDECADTSVVLRITTEDGAQILTQTEAGILARCGMNTHGVALTGNFLKCDRDNQAGGIPIPFVRRHILESKGIEPAMSAVLEAPKSFSTNLMISDKGGEAVDFETVPGETFWMQPDNGLLVHANHFESYAALAKVKDEGLKVTPCSLYRSRRVRDYLQKQAGKITLDHIKAAFSDKFGAPFSICAEPESGPGGENSSTVATILMDTTDAKMWIATKPYQAHTYTEYQFST